MIKKTLFIYAVLVIFVGNAYCLFQGNGIEKIIQPNGLQISSSTLAAGCETNIALAACYLFKSDSDFKQYLGYIEIGEFQDLFIQSAIDNLLKSNEYYLKAYSEFCLKDPLPEMVEKLKVFDYNGFMIKKTLNPVIFNKVKSFLQVANGKGVITAFNTEIKTILGILQKQTLTISELSEINRRYNELLLFGNYISEVMYNL
ncbi:MAG: hypothetical protein ACM3SY_10485 [Candidatus Omnitrophota bacterium]